QVTGRYPVRKSGRGLLPSPGWTGDYDWKGFLDVKDFPSAMNPAEGFIGTANNKTVGQDYPHVLSSSWYWPDRADRIREMLAATKDHTRETCMAMHLDTRSLSCLQMKKILTEGDLSGSLSREIGSWTDKSMKDKAGEALSLIRAFDGDMKAGSKEALVMSALTHVLTRDIFLDELGPEESQTWKAFITCNSMSYNATTDHFLLRGNESPYWDDVRTPDKETKAAILARSLAHAITFIEERLGKDRAAWSWGKLHTYNFITESSRMAPRFGFVQRNAMKLLSPYFNRGPFPAPGDYNTLNVSAYMIGKDFDTWLIPAMRIIVDFSQDEPLSGINSTGQIDNPSSPHYDDGIQAWLKGSYQLFPFAQEQIEKQYSRVLVMTPE
ncbi:penicillin acylase family protein, partial [bacterium]|nr:penicillin acylase family protein [bacterium]